MSRIEKLLLKIINGSGETDEPISRNEELLDQIASETLPDIREQIELLKSIGHFLALWDSETGLPETFPLSTPYEYHTGDYFIVSNVSDTTNYKPTGTSYTGDASTVEETNNVGVHDYYFYDGAVWTLLPHSNPDLTNFYTKAETDLKIAAAIGDAIDENYPSEV